MSSLQLHTTSSTGGFPQPTNHTPRSDSQVFGFQELLFGILTISLGVATLYLAYRQLRLWTQAADRPQIQDGGEGALQLNNTPGQTHRSHVNPVMIEAVTGPSVPVDGVAINVNSVGGSDVGRAYDDLDEGPPSDSHEESNGDPASCRILHSVVESPAINQFSTEGAQDPTPGTTDAISSMRDTEALVKEISMPHLPSDSGPFTDGAATDSMMPDSSGIAISPPVEDNTNAGNSVTS